MKKISTNLWSFFLVACSLFLAGSTACLAQNRKLDSLKQLVIHSKSDTSSSKYLWRIAQFYFDQKNNEDSTLFYASQGYALAEKHNYLPGMWVNLGQQCFVYQRHGNYQKTLRLYFDFLKLCEEKQNIRETVRVVQYISELYIKLEDYQQAISYAKKNRPNIIESNVGYGWMLANLYSIGIAYINLNQADSSLSYFQQGFALASSKKASYRAGGWLDQMLVGLGMANQQLGNADIAAAYYNEAIKYEEESKHSELPFAYIQKAKLLEQRNLIDSSIVYYQKALQITTGMKEHLTIYKALANIYRIKDPVSSVKYFVLAQNLSDSLFASDKLKAIEALTYNEQERQKELAITQKEQEETHKKNIENILITIGIISFLTLFLLLSRSIIVNEKWIRLLGIVGLLLLFEFINLLLHPLLEKLTHHSSVYMLLIMVCIAALLVPLHHKIEKWVTGKMVDKNKQVRIAAARRTIEQLEGKADIL